MTMRQERVRTESDGRGSEIPSSFRSLARCASVALPILISAALLPDARAAARDTQSSEKLGQAAYVCGSWDLYILPTQILSDCVRLSTLNRNITLGHYNNKYAMACSLRMFGHEESSQRIQYVQNEPRMIPRLFRQSLTDADVAGMVNRVSEYYSFNRKRIENDVDDCTKDPYIHYFTRMEEWVAFGLGVITLGVLLKSRL